MYIAYNYEKTKINVDDAVKGNTYFCPICDKKLYIKSGTFRRKYFCHYKNESCIDYWNYDESEWSKKVKSIFDINEIESKIGQHRADIDIHQRLSILLESKAIHKETFDEKTRYFLSCGRKVMWIFNFSDLIEKGKIFLQLSDRYATWKNPSRMFIDYAYDENVFIIMVLYSEVGNKEYAVIDNPKNIYKKKEIDIKRWLSTEQFIQYFNDIGNGVDPEDRYRLKENIKFKIKETQEKNLLLDNEQLTGINDKLRKENLKREREFKQRMKEERFKKDGRTILELLNENKNETSIIVEDINCVRYEVPNQQYHLSNEKIYGWQWLPGEKGDYHAIVGANERKWILYNRL